LEAETIVVDSVIEDPRGWRVGAAMRSNSPREKRAIDPLQAPLKKRQLYGVNITSADRVQQPLIEAITERHVQFCRIVVAISVDDASGGPRVDFASVRSRTAGLCKKKVEEINGPPSFLCS
jgi:hypothetical protein